MSDAVGSSVWVLLRLSASSHAGDVEVPKVLGVYGDYGLVEARIGRIAAANDQYPLRSGRADADGRVVSWVIGPVEDEGFFGNRPVHLSAVEVPAGVVEL